MNGFEGRLGGRELGGERIIYMGVIYKINVQAATVSRTMKQNQLGSNVQHSELVKI